MKPWMPYLLAAATLAGCATLAQDPAPDGLTRARIGQTVTVGGPKVTPLAVLEDSRCPAGVQCVWAGRVRISARITLGAGNELRELQLGKPLAVADGTLELAEVTPARIATQALKPGDYRLAFRFMGGR